MAVEQSVCTLHWRCMSAGHADINKILSACKQHPSGDALRTISAVQGENQHTGTCHSDSKHDCDLNPLRPVCPKQGVSRIFLSVSCFQTTHGIILQHDQCSEDCTCYFASVGDTTNSKVHLEELPIKHLMNGNCTHQYRLCIPALQGSLFVHCNAHHGSTLCPEKQPPEPGSGHQSYSTAATGGHQAGQRCCCLPGCYIRSR